LWGLILAAATVSGIYSYSRGQLGSWLIDFAVLLIAGWTLQLTLPKPAKLWVERQDELNLSDLIFFVVEETNEHPAMPRDFLLQLHVAVINVDGQNGVLSALKLEHFLDKYGRQIRPYQLPFPIEASQVVTEKTWELTRPVFRLIETPPPFVLEPNDVLTLRLRARRGIDWGLSGISSGSRSWQQVFRGRLRRPSCQSLSEVAGAS
jgi:hypothetical protein